jgi:electron transfer flavoprotein-quinone oxidoreductase
MTASPASDVGPEVDFDVIVVGAGIAGCVTAHQLARAGHEVLLVERGAAPGAKNLSGGVLYCRVLDQVWPDFASQAPVERVITSNRLTFLNAGSHVTLDYADERLGSPVNAVSVLRARLDPWLAEQCEAAGVVVMPGVLVESLLHEDERVVGIRAGDDELRAHVVVAADGVNSFLCRSIGIRQAPPAQHLALGVKSVIGLPAAVIEERFTLAPGQGTAYAVVGDCTAGLGGGGFLYTNRDSISVGIVVRLDELERSRTSASDLHDSFLAHPAIAPLIAGGEPLEYGCHLVAEGGRAMMHDLTRPGLVVVGDAAGLTLNTGFTVRGMDLAAGSGIVAAQVIHDSLAAGDRSATTLAGYPAALDRMFVGQDMATYARAPHFLERQRLYGAYGQLAADLLHDVYDLDTSPRRHLARAGWQTLRDSGVPLRGVTADLLSAVRSL